MDEWLGEGGAVLLDESSSYLQYLCSRECNDDLPDFLRHLKVGSGGAHCGDGASAAPQALPPRGLGLRVGMRVWRWVAMRTTGFGVFRFFGVLGVLCQSIAPSECVETEAQRSSEEH